MIDSIWLIVPLVVGGIAGIIIGITIGEFIEQDYWRRAAHENKPYKVGQDIYTVKYEKSEPAPWK